jgi:hypothetical protein
VSASGAPGQLLSPLTRCPDSSPVGEPVSFRPRGQFPPFTLSAAEYEGPSLCPGDISRAMAGFPWRSRSALNDRSARETGLWLVPIGTTVATGVKHEKR